MNKKVKNIFIKNFINLSLNQGLNILIAIIVTPILFKNLCDSKFGLFKSALSIFMLISMVVSYVDPLKEPKQILSWNDVNKEAVQIQT